MFHFNKIHKGIFVGTAPRRREHLQILKEHQINVIFNLQTEEDMIRNSLEELDSPESLSEYFISNGFGYIWFPTTDMSSTRRQLMIPQAAIILQKLLDLNHVIYVHCNAGVGRSINAVCGYLHYILKKSMLQVEYQVYSSRPAAFIDQEAILNAKSNFQNLYI